MVYDHTNILETLRPYANKGWVDRFQKVKSMGPTAWLEVVRDFPIDSPKIEQVVHEIVVGMEPKKHRRSTVRDEMDKLEMAGKFNVDSPEEAAKWQAKLDEEEARFKKEDEEADVMRKKQVETDKEHWRKQAERQKEDMGKPTVLNIDKPKPAEPPKPLIVDQDVKVEKLTPEEEAKARAGLVEQPEEIVKMSGEGTVEDDAPSAPVMPKLRAVSVGGSEVYRDESKTPVRTPITSLEGLPKEMIEKLAKKGITTVESFQKMDKSEAKATLGTAIFRRFEKQFK
jgi:hypothetical protein